MEFSLEGSFNLAVGLGVCNRILEGSIYFSELINLVRGGGGLWVGLVGGGGVSYLKWVEKCSQKLEVTFLSPLNYLREGSFKMQSWYLLGRNKYALCIMKDFCYLSWICKGYQKKCSQFITLYPEKSTSHFFYSLLSRFIQYAW